MKTSAIKESRKRKQKNESLLKIVNSKKTGTQRKMELTFVHYREGIKKSDMLQNKSGIFSEKKIMAPKSNNVKIVHD